MSNETKSKYALEQYGVLFDDALADKFKPIVYSHECLSGDPDSLFYRVLVKRSVEKMEFCIQYFFYWSYQWCMMASHRYDYEPIFIYLSHGLDNESNFDDNGLDLDSGLTISLIVNGGLGSAECGFHKNEIRPLDGERSDSEVHFTSTLTPEPYYPFGKKGSVMHRGCGKTYPLKGNDLSFENHNPLFGIRACSNVFSGAVYDLQGDRFNPPLKRLTDEVLHEWYFNHYSSEGEMPFGHDIADPFSYPYIKYHYAGTDLPKPKLDLATILIRYLKIINDLILKFRKGK
jgi:hypothetical protein